MSVSNIRLSVSSRGLVFGIAFGLIAAAAPASSLAEDSTAKSIYENALKLYDQRESPQKVDEGIAALQVAEGEVKQNQELKYNILLLSSQFHYWKGVHAQGNDAKKTLFNTAMSKADGAKKLNDSLTEGYYWYAVSLGQWATANGIIASLSRKNELIANIQGAAIRKTRDGKAGETYEGYGTARVLGRLYFKLPGFAGGSYTRSLELLNKAYFASPDYSLNTIYLAETLMDGDDAAQARAKTILSEMLKKDPSQMDREHLPETKEDFDRARELLKDLGEESLAKAG